MPDLLKIARQAHRIFPLPSSLGWMAFAFVLVTDILWIAIAGYHIAPASLVNFATALFCIIALTGFALYGRDRKDLEPVVIWASATLFVVVFSLACVVLSYLAASLGLPLIDNKLAAFDTALGFDWIGLLAFMNEHATFGILTSMIYNSLFPQFALVVLLLSLTRHFDELRELVDAYWITLLLSIVISGVLPALDPFGYYGLTLNPDDVVKPTAGIVFLPDLLSLRAGTFTTFDFGALQGMVAFPSFHAALALMMCWSLRRMPWVLLFLLPYNGLMLVATLTEGGHYLADVAAGSLILILVLALRHHLIQRKLTSGMQAAIASPARV